MIVYMIADPALLISACALLMLNPLQCYILFAADVAATGLTGYFLRKEVIIAKSGKDGVCE